VLHDWSDTDAMAILKNVRAAMGGADATLALVEQVGTFRRRRWSMWQPPCREARLMRRPLARAGGCEVAVGSLQASFRRRDTLDPELQVVSEPVDPVPVRGALDLQMAVMAGGQERTLRHWQRLLSAAGFALRRVHNTRSIASVIEAAPAQA
jgi:hypothetical protein